MRENESHLITSANAALRLVVSILPLWADVIDDIESILTQEDAAAVEDILSVLANTKTYTEQINNHFKLPIEQLGTIIQALFSALPKQIAKISDKNLRSALQSSIPGVLYKHGFVIQVVALLQAYISLGLAIDTSKSNALVQAISAVEDARKQVEPTTYVLMIIRRLSEFPLVLKGEKLPEMHHSSVLSAELNALKNTWVNWANEFNLMISIKSLSQSQSGLMATTTPRKCNASRGIDRNSASPKGPMELVLRPLR